MTIEPSTIADRLSKVVSRRATELQARYRENIAGAVADLAILRRGVAQPIGHDPRLIGLTVADVYPDSLGLPDAPLPAERAAYAALTLFAVHQQSHRNASMHREGYSFGRTARLLGRRTQSRDAVRPRFTGAATASSTEEILYHARGLIQQFRAYALPLDYGRFARDLYYLQSPAHADSVRLTWGRDFYRVRDRDDVSDAGGTDADDIEID